MKDDNGRVCIPIQMRKEMEISSGRSIEFLADGDKTIIQNRRCPVFSVAACMKSMPSEERRSALPGRTG